MPGPRADDQQLRRNRNISRTDRQFGGLGLGLYIGAQIARAHGGELTVRSSSDAGTVFEARLPIVLPR